MQVNLFDIIQNNFFNPLSSNSNNRVNSECLIRVYKLFDNEVSYRINRDIVRDTISAYIMSELDENLWKNDDCSSANDYAGAIIRRFYDCGWLIEEIDDVTYEKQVVMSEPGIALAELMMHLIKPSKTEYSSYVFNIYNRLQNKTQWESNPYAYALKPTYNDAKKLANSLKSLSTSIKEIIEKIVEEKTLEELTANLISYFEGSFIKEYSRLVKEQNIHFYRSSIISKLNEIQQDRDVYDLMVIDCYVNEDYQNEDEAEYTVDHIFKSTIKFLTNDYDKLMNEIQKKINIYLNLAVGRARFILNHDKNSRGYVQQVLKILIQNIERFPEFDTEELFNIYTQEFIDTSSLTYPKKHRTIKQTIETEVTELTQDDVDKAMGTIYKEAFNPYSKELVKEYVLKMMGDKAAITTEKFPMENKEDILSIMASIAYSRENGFFVTANDNYIETNGFIIRDFLISLSEGENK